MYIDPGTGSLVIQAIIAAIASGLFIFRSWWLKLLSVFTGRGPSSTAEDVGSDPEA